MSTRDLKHPWKPSVWIIWIGAIVLGSWLLQRISLISLERSLLSYPWRVVLFEPWSAGSKFILQAE